MKKSIITLITLSMTCSTIWASDRKPPKGFYSNLNIRYEHCKKETLDINIMLCFMPPDIHNAYANFTGAYGKTPQPEKAWHYLQIQGLHKGIKQYEERIPYLKKLGIQNDMFFDLYKNAAMWAENEKEKSADALYTSAYNPDNTITDPEIMYGFLRAYLKLSADKGHAKARQELNDISQSSWGKFLSNHGDKYPQLLKYKSHE